MYQKPVGSGAVLKSQDQLSLIKSTASSLAGMVRVLRDLGPLADDLDHEDLVHWLNEITRSRKELGNLVRLIEERAKR